MKNQIKSIFQVTSLVLFVLIFSYVLYIYDIENILSSIGVTNPYYFIFVIAALAGTSTFTSTSLYLTIIALASAQYNILLLGISGGVGLFIGDSFYYYLGLKFSEVNKIRKSRIYKFLRKIIYKTNTITLNLFVFLYASFSPIPNDILMFILGSVKIKYLIFASSLLIGNIAFVFLVALLGNYFL
ncbi:MAG: VTT domain-containing protein [Candidatus Nanoarchaeia archaeon]